jgi:GTP-binding protein
MTDKTTIPVVAIIGRPNVGKSSLFNWLAGRRIAIVEPSAGVTRDRLTTLVQTDDQFFELVDTGGIAAKGASGDFAEDVERQIQIALQQAQVILFVVDVRAGLTPLDEEVAKRLRPVDKPILCVVNKCDTPELEANAAEFYQLGREPVVYVSAMQNRGKEELLDQVRQAMAGGSSDLTGSVLVKDVTLKLAIVGRRNTGKSTFINSLVKAERMIVSETPGTTRDSVDVRFERDGQAFIAIDTAGARRKGSIQSNVEFYSLARAERSIRRAEVVLHFMDAHERISKVDKQLVSYILDEHKPAIFVVNKWDLMRPMATGEWGEYLRATFPSLAFVPIAFITAKNGKNVQTLLNLAQNLYKQAGARVSTGELNRVVRWALEQQSPPLRQNRRPKLYYATQVGVHPPTLVLFTNGPELFDNTYRRYLETVFHDHLPFHDIPIKLYVRHKGRESRESKSAVPSGRARRPVSKSRAGTAKKQKAVSARQSQLWKDV